MPEAFKTARKDFLDERRRKMETRKQTKGDRRGRQDTHTRSNRARAGTPSDVEMNAIDARLFLDVEMSSEDGISNRIPNTSSPASRQLSTPSPIPRYARSRSRSISESPLPRSRVTYSDSSESDTTWNPPLSDHMDRLSELDRFSDELERLSEISHHSRHPSANRSDSFSSGFMPSPSRSRTRSRSRNRSISRTTSASRSSRFLSR